MIPRDYQKPAQADVLSSTPVMYDDFVTEPPPTMTQAQWERIQAETTVVVYYSVRLPIGVPPPAWLPAGGFRLKLEYSDQ